MENRWQKHVSYVGDATIMNGGKRGAEKWREERERQGVWGLG